MLPVASRLRRRPEFTSAVRRGRRAGRPVLVVHLLIDPAGESTGDAPRAGFVVGRSVGGAVVRNRVRRRLRHLVRDRLDMLPRGSRLVVRAQPAAAGKTSHELGANLDAALASALRARARERVGAS